MKTRSLSGLVALATAATLACAATGSWAKLPTPSDEAKAKAAEAAAKAAHAGKVDSYKLCLAMDRVAAAYVAGAQKAGKTTAAATPTAACADPGAFAAAAGASAPAAAPAVVAGTPAPKK